nr:MAG TPA: hypothetical protein [Caudoviricetes sp.]
MYKRLSSAFFEIPVHNQCVIDRGGFYEKKHVGNGCGGAYRCRRCYYELRCRLVD